MKKIGVDRERIVSLLDLLEERNLFEVRAADVRQRYTLTDPDADAGALTAELAARFQHREAAEIDRLQRVLDLIVHNGCLTNALVGYFGEVRDAPCGHCSYCVTQKRAVLPVSPRSSMEMVSEPDIETWNELRESHSNQLSDPRQASRFLCGLVTPGLTRSRLTKNPLFGCLAEKRFADVFSWCGGK